MNKNTVITLGIILGTLMSILAPVVSASAAPAEQNWTCPNGGSPTTLANGQVHCMANGRGYGPAVAGNPSPNPWPAPVYVPKPATFSYKVVSTPAGNWIKGTTSLASYFECNGQKYQLFIYGPSENLLGLAKRDNGLRIALFYVATDRWPKFFNINPEQVVKMTCGDIVEFHKPTGPWFYEMGYWEVAR